MIAEAVARPLIRANMDEWHAARQVASARSDRREPHHANVPFWDAVGHQEVAAQGNLRRAQRVNSSGRVAAAIVFVRAATPRFPAGGPSAGTGRGRMPCLSRRWTRGARPTSGCIRSKPGTGPLPSASLPRLSLTQMRHNIVML